MSDNFPDGDQQQSLQTHIKERAEFISGVLTTVLEKEGYESAVAQTRKFFANSTPQQMEEMKSHLTSLALEFMIMAGFYKDRDAS
jgi:hypothetical protein